MRPAPIQDVPRNKAEVPDTWPKGRVCSCDGCSTRLSIYNPRSECAQCRPPSKHRFVSTFEELADLMQTP